MAEIYVSRDDVIKKAGYTMDEVANIDIDQFIVDEQITPELFAIISEEDLRFSLQKMIDNAATVSHEYLFADDTIPFAEFDLNSEQLRYIAVISTNDALIPSLLIDFDEKKAHFSNGNLFIDLAFTEKTTTLDSYHIDAIMSALKSANIQEWIGFYEGDQLEFSHYESIAIQTNEGLYRYKKTGHNTDAPITTTNLMLELYRMFW